MAYRHGHGVDAATVNELWALLASGLSGPQAARQLGLGSTAARRVVLRAGGVRPRARPPVSGLRLSFREREEIALLHAAGHGVRAIARELGRAASTVSRELDRNRVIGGQGLRGKKLRYRASTAH